MATMDMWKEEKRLSKYLLAKYAYREIEIERESERECMKLETMQGERREKKKGEERRMKRAWREMREKGEGK